jgi:hypothetical protein
VRSSDDLVAAGVSGAWLVAVLIWLGVNKCMEVRGFIGLGKYGNTRYSLHADVPSPLDTLLPLWVSERGLVGCEVDGEMGLDGDGVVVEVAERAFAQNLRNWRMNFVIAFSSVLYE